MAPAKTSFSDKFDVVTQEVVICQYLSSNDLKVRNRGVKLVKKLLLSIGEKEVVDANDYDRIWHGMFYYVWMSDKLLVQEETVETISKLIHIIQRFDHAMLFVRGFFNSLATQWTRISHYRTDKFLMFMRRMLRQILVLLKDHEWKLTELEMFSSELYAALLILPLSLNTHLCDIFNEEVAKVSGGRIPTDALTLLLKPFAECVAQQKPSGQVTSYICANVFGSLTRQLKLHIKQSALTRYVEDESTHEPTNTNGDNEETVALDPRPGGVDVVLPFIDFDEQIMIQLVDRYLSKAEVPTKARNSLTQILNMLNSVTKVRQLASENPDRLLSEMTAGRDGKRQRKKKTEFSKLIKKSCRKLEAEDNESDDKANERILRKLQSMGDLMQVPSGNSYTVLTSTKKAKKQQKTATKPSADQWTVTTLANQDNDGKGPKKKKRISATSTATGWNVTNSDWEVTEMEEKENKYEGTASNDDVVATKVVETQSESVLRSNLSPSPESSRKRRRSADVEIIAAETSADVRSPERSKKRLSVDGKDTSSDSSKKSPRKSVWSEDEIRTSPERNTRRSIDRESIIGDESKVTKSPDLGKRSPRKVAWDEVEVQASPERNTRRSVDREDILSGEGKLTKSPDSLSKKSPRKSLLSETETKASPEKKRRSIDKEDIWKMEKSPESSKRSPQKLVNEEIKASPERKAKPTADETDLTSGIVKSPESNKRSPRKPVAEEGNKSALKVPETVDTEAIRERLVENVAESPLPTPKRRPRQQRSVMDSPLRRSTRRLELQKKVEEIVESNKEMPKRRNSSRVLFQEQPSVVHYENDEKAAEAEKPSGVDGEEIIVPRSSVEGRPNLLKKSKKYLVVDFKSSKSGAGESGADSQRMEKISDSEEPKINITTGSDAEWQTVPQEDVVKLALKSAAEMTVDSCQPSTSTDTRGTRALKRKEDQSTPVKKSTRAVERKSTRIAEQLKQKKVEFKLEKNVFQDFQEYHKVLKSSPGIPYDATKEPCRGVLKPCPATPINPFYHANGEPKLKKLKKRK